MRVAIPRIRVDNFQNLQNDADKQTKYFCLTMRSARKDITQALLSFHLIRVITFLRRGRAAIRDGNIDGYRDLETQQDEIESSFLTWNCVLL